MTALELAQLHEQLAHAVMLILESILAAGFLTFCWMVAGATKAGRR